MSWYMESKFLFLRVGWGGEWSISYYFTTKIPFEVVFFFFIFLFFSLTKAWHFNKRLPNCEWKQNFKHFLNSIFFFFIQSKLAPYLKNTDQNRAAIFFSFDYKRNFHYFPPNKLLSKYIYTWKNSKKSRLKIKIKNK